MRERVIVGELTLSKASDSLAGNPADIIYTDPPWGPRMLSYFHTLNGSTGQPWPEFLNILCDVTATSIKQNGHVFMEMGEQWTEEVMNSLEKHGLHISQIIKCFYGTKKTPCNLLYSGPSAHSLSIHRFNGIGLIVDALKSVGNPENLVFDPCCGKGMTAKAARQVGMRFSGVELNPIRAAATEALLRKI